MKLKSNRWSTIYISVLIIAGLLSCNHPDMKKKIINRPIPLLNVSFVSLDTDLSNKAFLAKDLQEDSIIIIIDQLILSLDGYDINSPSDYFQYYNSYTRPLTFKDQATSDISNMKTLLISLKGKLLAGEKRVDLSVFDDANLFYSSLLFFRKEWFMRPNFVFSEKFYALLGKYKELIFNSYQYDNDIENEYHLPTYGEVDSSSISDHLIDSAHAKELITVLKEVRPNENKFVEEEKLLFLKLLSDVVVGKSTLILKNYSL